jgi:hypothetical protein
VVLVTAAVALGIGQLGRLPVLDGYRGPEEKSYRQAAALTSPGATAANVLIVGNSAAEHGVSAPCLARNLQLPRLGAAEPTVVNLSVPGGNPAISLWLWRRFARSHALSQVKLLVMAVAPIDLIDQSPGRDFSLRYLLAPRDAVALLTLGQLNDAAALLAYRAFPLFGRSRTARNLIARYRPPPPNLQGENKRSWWVGVYYMWYRSYRVHSYQVQCLERLIAEARSNGVQVVLVSLPQHRSLLDVAAGIAPRGMRPAPRPQRAEDATETPLWRFNVAVRECAATYRVPYLNYLTPAQSRRFSFADPPHLNPEGATRFTLDLAARINAVLARSTTHGSTGRMPS